VIRLFIPADFIYKYDSATVADMFLPSSNVENGALLSAGNIKVLNASGSEPMSLVFTGC